jgi:chemotaxis protein MotB
MPDAPGRLDAAVAAPTNLMEGTPLRGSGLASLPAIVDRLQSQGTPAVAQQGDRITILQISSAAFFGSGYAALSGAGKAILRDVAVTLKSDAYAGYNISIEGHTDDAPINTAQFQSNWELSTARAAAVVRFFLEQGIPARKLTAAGYADTFPVAPNRTSDGTVIPENQARNRRVVIKLEKIDKAER